MKNQLAKLVATGLYSGYGRPYPGTWGTVPAWLMAWFIIGGNQLVLGAAALVTFFVSIWAAGEAEKMFGHDARKIVIDEWAGMFITLLFVPHTLAAYAIAFFAFRGFDVVKIPPARQAERLPGGWGVTMDDVIAGIQANIATQLVIIALSRYGYEHLFV